MAIKRFSAAPIDSWRFNRYGGGSQLIPMPTIPADSAWHYHIIQTNAFTNPSAQYRLQLKISRGVSTHWAFDGIQVRKV